MIKVMTIVGTRPEIIKLSRVISQMEKYCEHILVHTGQNYDYELNEIFFKDLNINKPSYFLNAATSNVAETIGNIVSYADKVLEKENPDAVLLYGDTNSCLSVISAKRRKIPVFHFEAGNRCFDQRVPEELNRKIVDHLSDINMPLTEHARKYLINEGIKPETIIKTGSPMKEILYYYSEKINKSKILDKLKLSQKEYFIVSAHREENIDYELNFNNLIDSLEGVASHFDKKIIVSTHPRTMKKLKENNKINISDKIEFLKPMGLFDYVNLQKNSYCVISDSGTITEESSILNFPAIMIRQAHERPEGMDEGSVIMSGLNKQEVISSIELAVSFNFDDRVFKLINDYNVDNFSKKIIKIVFSYIEYINRTVWHKS